MPRQSGADNARSLVNFHSGEMLHGLARTYPSLLLTLLECIQNPIDADATRILVGLDLRNRFLLVADNGNGVSKERLDQALDCVGRGVKSKEKLGRFGRGLVAPVDKCRRFTFTSSPLGRRKSLQWTFVGADIKTQHHGLSIPVRELPSIPSLPRWLAAYATDEFAVDWRTQVALHGIVKDRIISLVDLDELESQVRQKFSRPMLQQGISVRVVLIDEAKHVQSRDINPVAYSGQPLPVIQYNDGVAGDVVFELYRAPKRSGKREGKVAVMEAAGSTPVLMAEFTRQARGGEWHDVMSAPFAALNSGYFEGLITCKNIELHPERTKFEYNEALHSLYLVISTWYDQHGRAYIENEQETSREKRYQQLGEQSLQHIRDVLQRPEFSRLWDSLTSVVSVGRLGAGHLDPEHGRPDGLEDNNSLRSGQGGAGIARSKDQSAGKPDDQRRNQTRDRSGDVPTGAAGPRGQRRRLVQGDSQGLWYEYSWLEGNSHLWEFDFISGVLTFNVRHPIWVELDETNGRHAKRNDRWIMELQEWLTLEVLVLLMNFRTPDALDEYRHLLDTKIRPYVELAILTSKA